MHFILYYFSNSTSVSLVSSQLVQELISTETEFLKEIEFFTSHHLKRVDEESTPSEITSQKETIFRNINDLKSFHSRYRVQTIIMVHSTNLHLQFSFLRSRRIVFIHVLV